MKPGPAEVVTIKLANHENRSGWMDMRDMPRWLKMQRDLSSDLTGASEQFDVMKSVSVKAFPASFARGHGSGRFSCPP